VENGISKANVAKELKIGEATVYRILRKKQNRIN
jgi:transposase